jgi:hypothetical protein
MEQFSSLLCILMPNSRFTIETKYFHDAASVLLFIVLGSHKRFKNQSFMLHREMNNLDYAAAPHKPFKAFNKVLQIGKETTSFMVIRVNDASLYRPKCRVSFKVTWDY